MGRAGDVTDENDIEEEALAQIRASGYDVETVRANIGRTAGRSRQQQANDPLADLGRALARLDDTLTQIAEPN